MQKESGAGLPDAGVRLGSFDRTLSGIVGHLYLRQYGIPIFGFWRCLQEIAGINLS